MSSTLKLILLAFFITLNAGCQHFGEKKAGTGKAVSYAKLPGWQADHHAEALNAVKKSCLKLAQKPQWNTICTALEQGDFSQDAQAKAFFEQHFSPHPLYAENGKAEGLITGYYEPLLHGSYTADARYRYPLYQSPDDLLIVDLSALYPDLKGKRVRGRLVGNKVLPYYSRAEIDEDTAPLKGQELLWVDDRDQLFFLQIQGSGRIELPDGKVIGAGYANQNGHAYISIGKKLIEMNELKREEVSLFTIKDWLKAHPERATELLNQNPSYVFFTLREDVNEGPRGSLNVPLTAERSLAIDPKFVALGAPIWLDTTYPNDGKHADNRPFQRLLIAQDTGGAIKGQLRADVFWGTGERAEWLAGNMKQSGRMFILLPNPIEP